MTGPRPSAPRKLPDGIQRLLLKAARDPAFADALVIGRADAAAGAGVDLTDSEAAVLAALDGDQLRTMIDALPPLDDSPHDEPREETLYCSAGIPPDVPPPPLASQGIAPDEPPPRARDGVAGDEPPKVSSMGINPDEPPPISKGHGADIPGRIWRWLRSK